MEYNRTVGGFGFLQPAEGGAGNGNQKRRLSSPCGKMWVCQDRIIACAISAARQRHSAEKKVCFSKRRAVRAKIRMYSIFLSTVLYPFTISVRMQCLSHFRTANSSSHCWLCTLTKVEGKIGRTKRQKREALSSLLGAEPRLESA